MKRPALPRVLAIGAGLLAALTAALYAWLPDAEQLGVWTRARGHPGEAIYQRACADCHERFGRSEAPHRVLLQVLTAEMIVQVLETGSMQVQGAALSPEERRLVAEFVTGGAAAPDAATAPPPRCGPERQGFDFGAPPAARGWGVDADNSRFHPAEGAGLGSADVPRLALAWAFAFPRAYRARSQPTVAGGAVFVGSQDGSVYALDEATGCARWVFRAGAEVRTAISVSPWHAGDAAARPLAYFGDYDGAAYAIDARSGELVWKARADEHPLATITGSPQLHEGRLFVPVSSKEATAAADPGYACCTFRGSVVALDAATGARLWQAFTIAEPPSPRGETRAGTPAFGPSGAAVWSAPTLDAARRQLYVGTSENYSSPAGPTSDAILAFDLDRGARRWVRQGRAGDAWNVACTLRRLDRGANCPVENGPDYDFGAPPLLRRLPGGRDVLVAGQKSGAVFGLDPDTGAVVWQRQVGRGGQRGGVHFGMAAEGGTVFVPISDAFDMLRHEREPEPGLHALDAATGEELWWTQPDDVCEPLNFFCNRGISAPVTAIPGAVFAGHSDGRLRAYDSRDGRLLWQFDTRAEFKTVSGEIAHGGSISGSGPVVARGRVLVNSGYGTNFQMPGNVLLVFAVDSARASSAGGRHPSPGR